MAAAQSAAQSSALEIIPAAGSVPDSASTADVPTAQADNRGGFAPLMDSGGTNNFGEIAGRVTLWGSPPPETPLDLSSSVDCTNLEPPTTHFFVTNSDGGLADVIVFINTGLKATHFPKPPNVQIVFTNCFVEPFQLVVATNQGIELQNNEHVSHALRFLTTGKTMQAVELKPGGHAGPRIFTTPRSYVSLFCNTHPWESASITVLEHPYSAITDREGRYRITNVPPGRYTLEAIHRQANGATTAVSQQIIVAAGKTSEADPITIFVPGASSSTRP